MNPESEPKVTYSLNGSPDLTEGKDFVINENGLMELTSSFLLDRGYCCSNGCKNCPYKHPRKPKGH